MATSAITIPLLLELAGRAALVLALAWVGARLAFRRSASTRYAVWAAGFIAAFALPLASGLLPAWRLAVLPPQDAPVVSRSVESAGPIACPANARAISTAPRVLRKPAPCVR